MSLGLYYIFKTPILIVHTVVRVHELYGQHKTHKAREVILVIQGSYHDNVTNLKRHHTQHTSTTCNIMMAHWSNKAQQPGLKKTGNVYREV